jgi:nicotinate dehydrogenase subunit A
MRLAQVVSAIELRVNGERRRVAVDPDVPLLYVLRNELGLVGARFGCGTGSCGTCKVIIGGRAQPSCQIPVGSVRGEVTTVEALGGEHPLQKAIIDEQAGQCGYCLTGIVMSAKALLDATPKPSEMQIRDALDGNICRCGSQPRILRAMRAVVKTT